MALEKGCEEIERNIMASTWDTKVKWQGELVTCEVEVGV